MLKLLLKMVLINHPENHPPPDLDKCKLEVKIIIKNDSNKSPQKSPRNHPPPGFQHYIDLKIVGGGRGKLLKQFFFIYPT